MAVTGTANLATSRKENSDCCNKCEGTSDETLIDICYCYYLSITIDIYCYMSIIVYISRTVDIYFYMSVDNLQKQHIKVRL